MHLVGWTPLRYDEAFRTYQDLMLSLPSFGYPPAFLCLCCRHRRQTQLRRELRQLTEEDRVAFFDTMHIFYTISTADGRDKYGQTFDNYELIVAYHNSKVANNGRGQLGLSVVIFSRSFFLSVVFRVRRHMRPISRPHPRKHECEAVERDGTGAGGEKLRQLFLHYRLYVAVTFHRQREVFFFPYTQKILSKRDCTYGPRALTQRKTKRATE